jgi:hypothetical protein
LNLPFEGAVYDAIFMLADVQTNETLRCAAAMAFAAASKCAALRFKCKAAIAIDGVNFGLPPNLLFLSPGQHKLVVRVPNVPDKMRRLEIQP